MVTWIGLRSAALAYAASVFDGGRGVSKVWAHIPSVQSSTLRRRPVLEGSCLEGAAGSQNEGITGTVEKGPFAKARGAQDGRRRLIDSARAIFRSKIRLEVSRLDIARHAGVAPGLVTYHFASNAELVLAVTRPVLTEAIEKLFSALDTHQTVEERLEQSAVLFIDFARSNAPLLDVFVEAVTESGDEGGQALIHACIDRLERFFLEMVEARLVAPETDPTLLLMAMWGMCRLIGQTPPLPLKNVRPEAGRDERTATEARFITRVILQGAKPIVG